MEKTSLVNKMPEGVDLDQVAELLRWAILDHSGVGVGRLAVTLRTRFVSLSPVLEACKVLGLASTSDGIFLATKLGEEFTSRPERRAELLKDGLAKIEPFSTAVSLSEREDKVESARVTELLLERGIRWHRDEEQNQNAIHHLLVQWAVQGELLNYDGKSGRFSKSCC